MVIDVKLYPCGLFLREERNFRGGLGRFSGCMNADNCPDFSALKKIVEENMSVFEKLKTGKIAVQKIELGVNCQSYKR